MIRSAKHILKFQTDFKTGQLEQIEKDGRSSNADYNTARNIVNLGVYSP
jgi:hypothetical protein